jgi:transcription elongation factor Elf1
MPPDATDEPQRTCPVCGQTKPVSVFYVVKAKHYAGGRRVKAVCKACDKAGAKERMRAYRARQPKPRRSRAGDLGRRSWAT